MSCDECGYEKLAMDSCMDGDLEWEDWFCLQCGHRWAENYKTIHRPEGEEECANCSGEGTIQKDECTECEEE